ncbi:hypothetical protein AAVH_18233 [Aphelenchoides avenae]|nr:hypothetical protein AAVH_34800 [Aphelenchus avenae]KAH7714414.1 hypothetical protein AAVH_18233 [Aphelenchus avenae]
MSQLAAPQRSRQRWVYFLTQAKTDLKCSSERDIALKLADPAQAANYLETVKKRQVSASGCMNVEVVVGWDLPAETAPALQDLNLTFVQFAEARGEHLDHPYLPLLKAHMKRGCKLVQLPLERLTMKVELGNPLKRPLPWLTDEDSLESPLANGIGTTVPSSSAAPNIATATASTDVLSAIASLTAKIDAHIKLSESQRKSLVDTERTLADLHATRGENIYLRTEVARQHTELETRRHDLLKANRELDKLREAAAAKQSAGEGPLLSDDRKSPEPTSFKDLLDYIGVDGEEAPTGTTKADDITVLEEGPKTADEASNAPKKKRPKPATPSRQ